jgi:IS6 family transposase
MLLERGLPVDHTTISRWVQRSAPELEKRSRPHLKATTDSWRVDETYLPLVGEPRRMVIKRQVLLVS